MQNQYRNSMYTHIAFLTDRTVQIALVAVVAIATGEILIAANLPIMGTFIHTTLLMIFLIFGMMMTRDMQALLAAFALAPLLRLLSLTVPITYLLPAAWPLLVSITLLVASGWAVRSLHLTRAELGLRLGSWKEQLLLIVGSTTVGGVLSWLLPVPAWNTAVPILAALSFGLAGIVEEWLFRGIIQAAAVRVFDSQGWIWSALISATLYISTQSVVLIALGLVLSLGFARIMQHTGTIWSIMLSHGIINVILATRSHWML